MILFSELPLLVSERVCGVKISDLSCLASGHNLNPTSEYMAGLQIKGIDVDNNNGPSPKNIIVPKIIPLPQLEEENSWRL